MSPDHQAAIAVNWPTFMRLKTLLTLIVNALILAFFAAFGLYMAQQVKVREQEELKNELLSTASILDLSIADDLLLE